MKLHKEFNDYLANLAVMNFKLHNLHWNVTGFHFVPVHQLTEEIYDEMFEFFDQVAEHQKMFNCMPDCKLSDYLAKASIKEVDAKTFDAKEVLEIVKEDLLTLKKQAVELRNASDEEDYFEAVALFEGHVDFYNKQLWFISSTLA